MNYQLSVSVCVYLWLILLEVKAVVSCPALKPASFVRLYRSKEEFKDKYVYA